MLINNRQKLIATCLSSSYSQINREPTLDKEEKPAQLQWEWHKVPESYPANVLGMTKCHKLSARSGSSLVE